MPLPPDFERVFAQTLADAALSRGERQALRAALNDAKPDPTLRAYRSQAFELATQLTTVAAIRLAKKTSSRCFAQRRRNLTPRRCLVEDDCVRRITSLIDAAEGDRRLRLHYHRRSTARRCSRPTRAASRCELSPTTTRLDRGRTSIGSRGGHRGA